MPTVTPFADVAQRLAGVFARRPAALFTDFDGTLSPVAPTPDSAEPAQGVRETLAALRERIDLVGIVTGRAADDARTRVGVPGLMYVGNHGLETYEDGEHRVHPAGMAAQASLPEAMRDIEQRLAAHASLDGVIFEDKTYSGSIHYRLAPEAGKVGEILAPIVHDVATQYGFWASDGKMVVELRPGATVNKGSAVESLVSARGLGSAVFLGDDVTDADAFRVLRALREEKGIATCSVGVLTLDTDQRVIDNADVLLDGVDDVVSMLLALLDLLPAAATKDA